jgi:hypothetical protein
MQVTGGTTDVTTYFVMRLAADGTGKTALTPTDFDLQYVRSGAAPSAKVDATALAATDSAHGDNKVIEIDATDAPGLYRIDWPDAAFAAGVREVILTAKCATAFTEHLRVLIDPPVDIQQVDGDSTAAANLNSACDNYSATRGLSGTALPAAAADAAGGIPVSDAGGLDMDLILTYAISSAAWGSINSGVVFRGTVTADDPGVSFTIAGLAGQGTGAFIDASTPWYAYVFRDAGGAAAAPQGEQRQITGYTSATGLFTTNAFSVPVVTGDDVVILAGRIASIPDILADTGELQTDWADGGRLDLILDIVAADTTTDIPGLIATAQADLDIITGATGVNLLAATQASIDAIETDTNELQTDWADGGRLDLLLDGASAPTAAEVATAVFDKTGLTAGGTVTFGNMSKAIYAMARGQITKTGDAYAYLDDDDATTIYTLTIASGSRTTA